MTRLKAVLSSASTSSVYSVMTAPFSSILSWLPRQVMRYLFQPLRFSASRMVIDYMHSCYLPATGTMTSTSSRFPPRIVSQ